MSRILSISQEPGSYSWLHARDWSRAYIGLLPVSLQSYPRVRCSVTMSIKILGVHIEQCLCLKSFQISVAEGFRFNNQKSCTLAEASIHERQCFWQHACFRLSREESLLAMRGACGKGWRMPYYSKLSSTSRSAVCDGGKPGCQSSFEQRTSFPFYFTITGPSWAPISALRNHRVLVMDDRL